MAWAEEVPVSAVVMNLDASLAIGLLIAMFSPIDLLFYGFAVYEGYRLSFRTVSPAEMEALAAV